MTNTKSCSDLAEIFSVTSFIYLKNIIFYTFIFYLALLKSYQQYRCFIFGIFFTVHCLRICSKTVSQILASCLRSSQQFKLFKYLLYLLRYEIKCDENPENKRENALFEKISKSYFQPFLLLKLSQSNPILSFYNKKAKKYSLHILNMIKKRLLQKSF